MTAGQALPSWTAAFREGDSPERRRFLEAHLELVRYTALRLAARLPACVEVDDLVHDGVVGLLDAASKFDPRHGVRFKTYAEARVRGAILDGLRHKDWRPRSVRRNQRDLDAALGRAGCLRGAAPTEEQIAACLGVDLEKYRALLQDSRSGPLLSLDDLPPGGEGALRAESPAPDGRLERRDVIQALAEELKHLPERERQILELYYHEGLQMKEIGGVLGVTESRVCQLHAQATARLRVALSARLHAPPLAGAGAFTRGRTQP
jgi:RNA polymerase sigma factor for flagellar operon FliA